LDGGCDQTIRGHVFCSFLALVLKRELEIRMEQKGLQPRGPSSCAAWTTSNKSNSFDFLFIAIADGEEIEIVDASLATELDPSFHSF
jgi:hypothetical protein